MKVICNLSSAPHVICLCACACVSISEIIISIHLVVSIYWGKEKGHVFYKNNNARNKAKKGKKKTMLLSMKNRFKVRDDYTYSKLQLLLLIVRGINISRS